MAELKNYEHADQIRNPDDGQLSGGHNDTRLERQQALAQNEVNKSGVDGLADFFDTETTRNRPRNVQDVIQDTQSRVMTTLTNAANEYVSSLNQSSSARLEALAWNQRRGDVLARIQNINANTALSATVAEGYVNFLKEAQSKATSEWEKQKATNQEALEQFGFWDKFWHADTRYQRFEQNVDNRLDDMFARLTNNANTIQSSAEARVSNMQSRIETQWNATIAPDQKQNLWNEAQTNINAANIASVNFTHFNVPNNDQDKVDFVEALRNLPFIQKGLSLRQNSTENYNAQKDLIEATQLQEDYLEKVSNYHFENVITLPEFTGMKGNPDNAPAIPALVSAIEKDLRKNKVNVEDIFPAGVKKSDLLTNTARLVYLVEALNNTTSYASHLAPATLQSLLDWVTAADDSSANKVEQYDNTEAIAQFDIVNNPTTGLNKQLEDCLTTSQSLKISTGISHFEGFVTTAYDFDKDCKVGFESYKRVKDAFPDKDRQTLDDIWSKLNDYATKITKLADQWHSEKVAHAKWKKEKTTAEKERDDVVIPADASIATIQATIGNPATGKYDNDTARTANVAKLQSIKRKALERYKTYEDSEPGLSSFTDFATMDTQLATWKSTTFTPSASVSPVTKSLNKRIKDQLFDSFSTDLESTYLSQMEANDQFELLKKMHVGTRVRIEFKDLAASADLEFPKQLEGSTKKNFRINQITDKGIELTALSGLQTITLLGPAVKEGDPYKNCIIQNRVSATSPAKKSGTMGMAFNFQMI